MSRTSEERSGPSSSSTRSPQPTHVRTRGPFDPGRPSAMEDDPFGRALSSFVRFSCSSLTPTFKPSIFPFHRP
jgi:hypothetical protein